MPTVGRIVHYTLSAQDVQRISPRRTSSNAVHIGNEPREGDVVPMMIVRVWQSDQHSVNGQAFLDGTDVLWVTSAIEGSVPGTWAWPPRTA